MRAKYIVIILFLALLFAVYQQIKIRENAKKGYEILYNSKLDGRMTYLSVSGGLIFFRLNNSEDEYAFSPRAVNRSELFSNTADKGDRIMKQAHSDTLKLFKNEKIYLYTFKKFE